VAAGTITELVRIVVPMLKFEMEAKVVHLLEEIIAVPVDAHRRSAPHAKRILLGSAHCNLSSCTPFGGLS
jgi:hypothetical protein